MSSIKTDNLKRIISNSGLSIAAAERKAGLKRNSIQNLLYGKSKTASRETVEQICNALTCSPKDIIEEISVSLNKRAIWDEELFLQIVKYTSEEVESLRIIPYFEEMILILQDAYTYTLEKTDKRIDKDFINWLIKKHFV